MDALGQVALLTEPCSLAFFVFLLVSFKKSVSHDDGVGSIRSQAVLPNS